MRFAVSSGMDVKRETTSKDIMISSGSSLRSICTYVILTSVF